MTKRVVKEILSWEGESIPVDFVLENGRVVALYAYRPAAGWPEEAGPPFNELGAELSVANICLKEHNAALVAVLTQSSGKTYTPFDAVMARAVAIEDDIPPSGPWQPRFGERLPVTPWGSA